MHSWRLTRRLLRSAIVFALVAAFIVVGNRPATNPGEAVATRPAAPAKIYEKKVPEVAAPPAKPRPEVTQSSPASQRKVVAELPRTTVKNFSLVGVTWDAGSVWDDLTVDVRWREGYGWSAWTELHLDLENTATEGGRPGTEPQWVGSSDGVAVRVSSDGGPPTGLKVATIDPGVSSDATPVSFQSDTVAATVAATDAIQTAAVAQPSIILRSAWGASNTSSCDSPIYGQTTRGAVIHHTAGSNSYSQSDSASIVKATQAYHTGSRGWCDIGYNFLVDKYGQIFEGRRGGIDKPVRGAHAGNGPVNEETMGVSLMGTFSTTEASTAMKTAVVNLVGWRFAGYGIPAKGTYSLGGKTLNRIAGHRNVVSTECPGQKVYDWLSVGGGLRDRVATKLAQGGQDYATPTNLRSTAATATSLSLAWNAVAGAPGYRIQISPNSTMSGATYHGFTGSSGVVSGLTAGKKYYFRVVVVDANNVNKLSDYTPTPYPSATTPATVSSESYTVPSTRTIALTGHGFGHGIGMGQYGARGAAKQGLKYDQILSHYYPGTALASKSGNIRVLLTADSTDSVLVEAEAGLRFRNRVNNAVITLPASIGGKPVIRWQIVPTPGKASQSSLQYRTGTSYVTYNNTTWTGEGQFEGPADMSLVMPAGGTVRFRGALRSVPPSAGVTYRNTVNVPTIENYVRGVVSAEMPATWEAEALKAQSVAARTYGVRSIKTSGYYDICDTTSCQVYGGASRETSTTDAAIAGTSGKILTYGGSPAFTQFSSSTGGYSATGSQAYLKAVKDPYDTPAVNPNHTWTASVAASKLERAYTSLGTLKQLKITQRTGFGDWGGRVVNVSLIGSNGTVSISGTKARTVLGLKSHWFRFGS